MKINIRKCLLACMASMTLISFTAYGSEQSDQDQILREIAERIAASGDILDKIQEGAPWEDVQKLVEDLKPMDVGGPGLDSEEGESRGASMTGAMVGAGGTDFGGGSSSNINLELARLQIQLANSTKDTMTPYMNEINRIQKDQNRAGSFLSQARQIQKSAESSRKSIAMPDTMKFYMDTNKISYPKSNQGLLYSSDQWKSVIRGLEDYIEKTGAQVQSLMVKMQELMGEYNSYSQGASSSLQGGYKPLQGITRGQSLFSQHGGAVNTAPIATSMIIGVLIGMAVMWGILKKKGQGSGKEAHS